MPQPPPDYLTDLAPPHNTEAEQSVLGSLLIDPEMIHGVLQIVRAVDFYHPKHREIFGAMVRIANRGEPTDFTMVCAEIERVGATDRVGGMRYLGDLLTVVPTSAHAEHYAAVVRRCSFGRALIAAAGAIARIGYANPADMETAMSEAEAALAEVRNQFCPQMRTRCGPRPLWEVVRGQ